MRLVRGIAVLSVATVGVLGLAACTSDSDAPASTSSATAETDEAPAKESSSDLTADNFVQRITDAQIAAAASPWRPRPRSRVRPWTWRATSSSPTARRTSP
ncbi:hypothetical protein NKG05_13205 [Oerskovia sp. M15]